MAHPLVRGAARIAPPALLGKLFRLFGADATIFPNHGGRFGYSRETCMAIARAAREPWAEVRPALPVPAGGMRSSAVDEMVSDYGRTRCCSSAAGSSHARDKLLDKARSSCARCRARA
jgi:ribulose-bisphosphate carboxylase large chain